MNKNIFLSLLFCLSIFSFSSCNVAESYDNQNIQSLNEKISESIETETEKIIVPEPITAIVTTSETNAKTTVSETEQVTNPITQAVTEKVRIVFPADVSLDLSSIPEYSNLPYVEVNADSPYFDVFTDEYFEKYPDLDRLGRCGSVFEMLGPETMPEVEREGIGMIKPSGWHTVKYPELISDLYLYNRCHLIGFQLCGKNADERNLITGTRFMNVEGMLRFEEKTASYIRQSGNHVLYRVTPIFDGSDLVAKGVLMEALSVEDGGSGLSFCIFCYNVQPGIGINYSNGESWVIEEPAAAESEAENPEVIEREISVQEENIGQQYVLNTNTKKFHYPYCNSVNQMKEKNKREYTGTRDEVISQGYAACKNCNP